MKTKEITLFGKAVNICYCLATEIEFLKATGADASQLEGNDALIFGHLVRAGHVAYCMATGEEPVQFTANDILYNTNKIEATNAVSSIMALREEWYAIPSGYKTENAATEEQTEEKNA